MYATTVPIDRLMHDPSNARTHNKANIAAIKGSLAKFGQQKPIVVTKDNIVIAGNGTLQAARELGWKEIGVVYTKLSGPEAMAYGLADNRTTDMSDWDEGMLGQQLQSLYDDGFDIADIGFDPGDWVKDLVLPNTSFDNDKEDEIPTDAPTRVKRGQIWELGKHRLMCGDSTSKEVVSLLMSESKADLVFTDPPYNHASDEKLIAKSVSKAMDRLANSEWDKNFSFSRTAEVIEKFIAKNATIYVCTSWHLAGEIWSWMSTRSSCSGYCVWHKPNPMPSLAKRHWTWSSELICYATVGKHTFNFPEEGHASNVWTINKNQKNDLHPTMKPVSLVEHAIMHSSRAGDLVMDLFLGSGTTLIACEKTGRRCFGMEIDEKYCDVIIARWESLTGKQAKLIS